MRSARVLCLLVLLVSFVVCDDDAPANINVVEVTPDNFNDIVRSSLVKPVYFEVYAPWCGFCKRIIGTYEEVALKLKGDYVVSKLDGSSHEEIARSLDVKGFPSIFVLFKGIAYTYEHNRETEPMVDFIVKKTFLTDEVALSSKIYALGFPESEVEFSGMDGMISPESESEFDKLRASEQNKKTILFACFGSAKPCATAMPLFKKLSLEKDIRVLFVDRGHADNYYNERIPFGTGVLAGVLENDDIHVLPVGLREKDVRAAIKNGSSSVTLSLNPKVTELDKLLAKLNESTTMLKEDFAVMMAFKKGILALVGGVCFLAGAIFSCLLCRGSSSRSKDKRE